MHCSIRMPMHAGDDEGERHRDQQRIVEQAGVAGADVFLHHEGHVGADHDHLAVRHVDDAHHAERDGKTDRGEQQHRAERKPVPEILHRGPDRKRVLDRGDGVAGGTLRPRAANWPAGRPAGSSASWSPRPRTTLMAASLSASEASSELRIDGGARLGQRLLDPRVGFLRQRRVERRQRACVARFEHRLRGLERLPGSRTCSLRPPSAASMRARSRLLIRTSLRSAGRAATGAPVAASNSLSGGVLVEDLLLLGAERQPAVLQRLDDGRRRADRRSPRPRRCRCRSR